jgi:hypothetical protein
MAIYHFSTKPISRKHKSSVAVSAYINAEKYTDERTNRTFDYSNKKGVLDSQCYAFDENNNRIELKNTDLWNGSEQAEAKNKRQDSARTAREYIVAMPHELFKNDIATGVNCITDFCDKLAQKYNVAVEFALHDQDYDEHGNGNKNYHFHLITTTRAVTFDDQNNIVFGKKTAFEMSDSDLKKMGEKRTKDQLIDIRKMWADVANKYLEKHDFDERIDHRTLKEQGLNRKPKIRLSMADSEKEKNGERTKAGDYNRAIDQSIALKQELAEIEKSLKKYDLLEKLGDTTSKISEKSDLFFEVFADDDDDDDFYNTASAETLVFKPKTAPAPMPPTQNNNAKNEAVERPAPTVETPKQPIKNNENKAKEVLATKAPTATAPASLDKPQAQAQPSPVLTAQKTPTPPPPQAKTAQQQALQDKPTPPTPPRTLKDDRAEDKAPVKPTITQEPPQPPQLAEEQQKPLTAYDRPINDYYDILATHKRSFAKQNDISTVKKLYPSDEPIYLNFVNDKGSISLNKGKQKTDLHFEIYKRFREVADKATSEIKRTSEVIRNYMSLSVNQFTARYNIELTDADKKDIESKDRLLKIDDFKNNYVEKEKPQLTPNESAKLKGQSIKLN